MSENMNALLAILLALNLVVILSVVVVRFTRRNRQKKQAAEMRAALDTGEDASAERSVAEDTRIANLQGTLTAVELIHVRDSLMACTSVLHEVIDGNYDARVDLKVDLTLAMSDELSELGFYLNTALDHLTQVIIAAHTESTGSSTLQQSWEDYARETRAPTGFRYERHKGVSADDSAWMPVMAAVTETLEPVQQQGELAVPLALGTDVIGALGLKRDADQVWTSDELLLIQDVVDQLTQTIDRLRLVEDVSRRAALEQTTGAVTASIRSEVEIEGVLQRALEELGQALQADAGTVYLNIDPQQETVQ